MHRLAMLVVSVMLALGTIAWSAPAATVAAQDAGYAPDDQESAFLDLINGYRAELGIGPLEMNYQLGAAADYHSTDMATNDYFDHYLYDGTDPGTNIAQLRLHRLHLGREHRRGDVDGAGGAHRLAEQPGA